MVGLKRKIEDGSEVSLELGDGAYFDGVVARVMRTGRNFIYEDPTYAGDQ